MKAVDFIKKFGWEKAKDHLSKMDAENWHNYFFSDLKQYVDAYELVQKHGGLSEAKAIEQQYWNSGVGSAMIVSMELKQAIALVKEVENEIDNSNRNSN